MAVLIDVAALEALVADLFTQRRAAKSKRRKRDLTARIASARFLLKWAKRKGAPLPGKASGASRLRG